MQMRHHRSTRSILCKEGFSAAPIKPPSCVHPSAIPSSPPERPCGPTQTSSPQAPWPRPTTAPRTSPCACWQRGWRSPRFRWKHPLCTCSPPRALPVRRYQGQRGCRKPRGQCLHTAADAATPPWSAAPSPIFYAFAHAAACHDPPLLRSLLWPVRPGHLQCAAHGEGRAGGGESCCGPCMHACMHACAWRMHAGPGTMCPIPPADTVCPCAPLPGCRRPFMCF